MFNLSSDRSRLLPRLRLTKCLAEVNDYTSMPIMCLIEEKCIDKSDLDLNYESCSQEI